jgi:hypothetical protein
MYQLTIRSIIVPLTKIRQNNDGIKYGLVLQLGQQPSAQLQISPSNWSIRLMDGMYIKPVQRDKELTKNNNIASAWQTIAAILFTSVIVLCVAVLLVSIGIL